VIAVSAEAGEMGLPAEAASVVALPGGEVTTLRITGLCAPGVCLSG
jgi:hypothetical protein